MNLLKKLTHHESLGGILLFLAALFAIILSNSPWRDVYQFFLEYQINITIGSYVYNSPLIFWINDGLMTFFFLVIGLEIKREIVEGVLQRVNTLLLPLFAAFGGLLVPALIYALFNWDSETAIRGWAIPTATDVAFSLGILSLLGRRVPLSLKVFLTALAIMDDIAAIFIIAVYYTADLSLLSLLSTFAAIALLTFLNYSRVSQLIPYYLVGLFLWASLAESGIHPTLAGIVLAMFIPVTKKSHEHRSPLVITERELLPWVTFLILPIFAFANSGFSITSSSFEKDLAYIPIGIMLGLFFGKQIGIMLSSWIFIRFGGLSLPEGVTWSQLYGISLLCGVGFTMSLFIGGLAFEGQGVEYANVIRVGVLGGSTLSGILGYLFLRRCLR